MITSSSNVQVKTIEKLMKSSRERAKQKLYVCEGIKMFLEIMQKKDCLVKAYFSESFLNEAVYGEKIEGRIPVPYEILSDSVFRQTAETKTPQGVLGLVRQPEYRYEDLTDGDNANLLVLEDVNDPGNLGTIVRTAEGAGVTGIILSRGSVDIFSPKVIRATMGAIDRVPFLYTDDFAGTLKRLKESGVSLYAAHLSGSVCYDEPDYRGASAILIGNEANGLTEEAAALADRCIRIPMEGAVESLNAGVAAAILMYEVYRQRRRGTES